MKLQKTKCQPKDPWLAIRAPHSTTPQVHRQNWRNNPAGKANTNITNMWGNEETEDQETCAEIDFSIDKLVSCHIPMEALSIDVEKFKGSNITNCFEKRANIRQDQFVLNTIKFGLTNEFIEVPMYQFTPPLNFFHVKLKLLMQKFLNVSVKVYL